MSGVTVHYDGKAVVLKNIKGFYFFRLVANNGEVIAASEQYTQKHNATDILDRYFSNFYIDDQTVD